MKFSISTFLKFAAMIGVVGGGVFAGRKAKVLLEEKIRNTNEIDQEIREEKIPEIGCEINSDS